MWDRSDPCRDLSNAGYSCTDPDNPATDPYNHFAEAEQDFMVASR
jgi:hypothetical protein